LFSVLQHLCNQDGESVGQAGSARGSSDNCFSPTTLWKWCWGISRREQSGGDSGVPDFETSSAHRGVQDDDLNMICLGSLVAGHALAGELVNTFLAAQFSGAERHRRRLAKVAELEGREIPS
jgi:hypothetical protein